MKFIVGLSQPVYVFVTDIVFQQTVDRAKPSQASKAHIACQHLVLHLHAHCTSHVISDHKEHVIRLQSATSASPLPPSKKRAHLKTSCLTGRVINSLQEQGITSKTQNYCNIKFFANLLCITQETFLCLSLLPCVMHFQRLLNTCHGSNCRIPVHFSRHMLLKINLPQSAVPQSVSL